MSWRALPGGRRLADAGAHAALALLAAAALAVGAGLASQAQAAGRQGPPSSWREGAAGYRQASAEAAQLQRPLLVYFRTDWCPYCRELERELLSSGEVETYLRQLSRVRVNPEAGADEDRLARAYGVDGYPALFLRTPVRRSTGAPLAHRARAARRAPAESARRVRRHAARGGERPLARASQSRAPRPVCAGRTTAPAGKMAVMRGNLPSGPAVLCVAHPGHELRVHGWLQLARPLVVVLTDGSGRSGESRLEFTRQIVREAGAEVSTVFGRWSDAEAYAAVLVGKAGPFLGVVDELAALLIARGARYVTGDAIEGYNAMHDLCRLILNAAVARASAVGVPIGNYEFKLTGSPLAVRRDGAISVRLDEAALTRKLAAARACPDLALEVDEALSTLGAQAFATEWMAPTESLDEGDGLGEAKPFYESCGERRVGEGKYQHVLRRREHVLPLAAALWRHAGGLE